MKNRIAAISIILLSVFTSHVSAQERPELGNNVYTYSSCGPDPTYVHILRVGKKADKEFLVQIVGIDHELNGRVIIYKAKDLQSNRLRYSFVNEKAGKVISSLLFDGSDANADLYIQRYAGLYTPSGRLPDNNTRRLCLADTSLNPIQYYRRFESQKAAMKKAGKKK